MDDVCFILDKKSKFEVLDILLPFNEDKHFLFTRAVHIKKIFNINQFDSFLYKTDNYESVVGDYEYLGIVMSETDMQKIAL